MIALTGILMVGMIGFVALAVDFGRLGNLKADLQTDAEAAALAGAIELIPTSGGTHSPGNATDTARVWAINKNTAMQAQVTVLSSQCSTYSDADGYLSAWVNSCSPSIHNAIKVTVARQASGLFMSALGVAAPVVRATAVAAIQPQVTNTFACVSSSSCRVFIVPNP
jgi:uncharacterized membrane protein